MEQLTLGPRDVYEYVCEKCGATKTIKVTGEGRKVYVPAKELMCGWRGCLGAATLKSGKKVEPFPR